MSVWSNIDIKHIWPTSILKDCQYVIMTCLIHLLCKDGIHRSEVLKPASLNFSTRRHDNVIVQLIKGKYKERLMDDRLGALQAVSC